MRSTIEDLWYGNLSPCENCGVGDAEIKDLLTLMSCNEQTLRKELGEQHRAIFSDFVRWSDKYACYISAHAFREGFRLASKLLIEALRENP